MIRLVTWLRDWHHLYFDMEIGSFIDDHTSLTVGGDFILWLVIH
jgi:hypothetical protein